MGQFFSRQNARIEEQDASSNNAYRYPTTGNYFANHFIMGGERFETTQPEAYLFGDNYDLNFLGRKPTPFPYPAPQPNEPTKTLRCLMNVRKESLRFVKVAEAINTSYNIEFTFDTDVKCGITIYYFCTEDITANGVTYTPRDAAMNSETYYYKKGVNQQFSQVSHVFDPSSYSDEVLCYTFEDEVIPVLIQCVAEEGEEPRQSHSVIAVVEKNPDGSYTLKPLKQKLFIDGLCYLLQEIYGIENKNIPQTKNTIEEDIEDSGSECVICMSDTRDTLILPCRHLCLCNSCADSLRYQANNCPICRAPFRALLQIRAVRKSNSTLPAISGDNQCAQDIPPGYELVSLIEALNGPASVPSAPALIPGPIPPFGNSPNIRSKHKYLERKLSSSASRVGDESTNKQPSLSSEVVIASITSDLKTESLTRGEGKKHRKGFRTSSAPEKIRLFANSLEMVNEFGNNRRRAEKDTDLAETKSLLESNFSEELCPTSPPCNSSTIFLSTPHSLHLCEKTIKDVSPNGGDESDYFTPEDPGTTMLVDQATDTSFDITQDLETIKPNDHQLKIKGEPCLLDEHRSSLDRISYTESDSHSKKLPLTSVKISENDSHPLADNSNNVKVDSLSETSFSNQDSPSSTLVLLQPQSYVVLPE